MAKNKISVQTMVFIGIAIVCVIIFAVLNRGENNENTAEQIDLDNYQQKIEKDLERIILSLDGIDNVDVMVTFECGFEYVYAVNTDASENSESIEYHKTGSNDALLIKEIFPKVSGVAVVCDSVSTPELKSVVLSLVSSALDISVSKVFVEI